ncbi:MAG TPA: ABC transporter ATP-binding protein [Acidimicrobiales bacterium]|nr:ABC transporter ATP-binding protein [Acidimicrobiales bacterium]
MSYVRTLIRFTAGYFVPCTAFAIVLFCVLPLALGFATQAFFDALTGDGALGVWTVVAVLVALQLSEVVTALAISRAWSGFSYKTHALLQRNMFAGILRGFGAHGLTVPPGDAISRFSSDPPAITMGSMDGVCDLIGRAAFGVVAAVVMWRIDPLLTAAAFAPVVAATLVSDALGSRSSRYGAAALDSTTSLSRFLGEVVNAQLAVRIAGARERVVGRLADIGETRRRLSLRDRVFAETLNSTNYHLVHISTGAVLLIGAARIRSGAFTVGDIALFVVFLGQLTFLPAEIGRVITELKRTQVSIERMHALMPGEPPRAVVAPAPVYLRRELPPIEPPPPREALERLEVAGLTCRHPASGRGIEDVSLTLERGSFTVVTGRIGSGKTTLLHALLGLLPATGEVRWNGRVLDRPDTFLVPPRCAFTPQVPRLFSEALRDNLLLGRPEYPDAVADAVRAAVLDDDVAGLERGLHTLVGPRGVKLSGGQVQRAAAARMFLGQAELLVFDDLSSALDTATEAQLWARLFGRRDDVTCLVVSHSRAALARADQVLTLNGGRRGERGGAV